MTRSSLIMLQRIHRGPVDSKELHQLTLGNLIRWGYAYKDAQYMVHLTGKKWHAPTGFDS
jgi:hypothetical protein